MSNPVIRRNWRILLFFSLVFSLIGGFFLLAPAAFAWCGDSSCFGHRDPGAALLFVGYASVVATLPLFLIPWTERKRIRFPVAILALIAFAVLGFLAVLWIGAHN